MVRSCKLPRNESPTSKAPVSTAVATATPKKTARLPRQCPVKFRRNKRRQVIPNSFVRDDWGGQTLCSGARQECLAHSSLITHHSSFITRHSSLTLLTLPAGRRSSPFF